MFNLILESLNIKVNENIAIVSPSIKELIYDLSILCAIQNLNIEYVNNEMYYTGPLRRNIQLRDEDFELNLEDYDVDDLG